MSTCRDGTCKQCLYHMRSSQVPAHTHSTYATGRVDANLLVQLEVCERKLHSLLDLLLLNVHTADVLVLDIGTLRHLHGADTGVCLRRENIHHLQGAAHA